MITLINVFTVEPGEQQRLVDLLVRATEVSVSHAPGFLGSTLHRSTDGTKITMVAEWQSLDHYQAMRGNQDARPYLEEALTFATFEPGVYEVVRSFAPTTQREMK